VKEIVIRVRNYDDGNHGTIEVAEGKYKICSKFHDPLQEPYIFDPAFWLILEELVDNEGRTCIDPMEVSDEEFDRHKKEMHERCEQWFLNLCQGIWNEYFAGMFTTKGANDGSDGHK